MRTKGTERSEATNILVLNVQYIVDLESLRPVLIFPAPELPIIPMKSMNPTRLAGPPVLKPRAPFCPRVLRNGQSRAAPSSSSRVTFTITSHPTTWCAESFEERGERVRHRAVTIKATS